MKTATIQTRINLGLKKEAESIIHEIGLSLSDAITIYLKQIVMTGGIPLELKVHSRPNKKTKKVLDEANEGKNLVHYKSNADMFKKLDL